MEFSNQARGKTLWPCLPALILEAQHFEIESGQRNASDRTGSPWVGNTVRPPNNISRGFPMDWGDRRIAA
jgi:hypothetical protein